MSFYTKKNWFLGILQFFLWVAIGCSFNNQSSIKEEINVILPQWPPKGCLMNEYPKLSRWEVSVCSATTQKFFYLQDNDFSITVNKNEPVSILVVPITIFQNNDETLWTNSQVTRCWNKYTDLIGISITPHQLRHYYCTQLFESGIDVKTAQLWLGHSDIKTTMQIYTHLDAEYKNHQIDKLDDYLSKIG